MIQFAVLAKVKVMKGVNKIKIKFTFTLQFLHFKIYII